MVEITERRVALTPERRRLEKEGAATLPPLGSAGCRSRAVPFSLIWVGSFVGGEEAL